MAEGVAAFNLSQHKPLKTTLESSDVDFGSSRPLQTTFAVLDAHCSASVFHTRLNTCKILLLFLNTIYIPSTHYADLS